MLLPKCWALVSLVGMMLMSASFVSSSSKSIGDDNNFGLGPDAFYNEAMLTYCNELRASQVGRRIYVRERLEDFCIMKVALFSHNSMVSRNDSGLIPMALFICLHMAYALFYNIADVRDE